MRATTNLLDATVLAAALLVSCSPAPPANEANDQAGSASDPGQTLALTAGHDLIGTRAPRLQVRGIDGDVVDLGALAGRRPIYLKFWATWCAPCREQMPHFARTYHELGDDLEVVAVNTGFNDDEAAIRRYRNALGLTMPMAMDDGSLAAALNLRVTPQHVVIGRDGRILYVGHLADATLDAALRAAAAGATAASDQTSEAVQSISPLRIGDRAPNQGFVDIDGNQTGWADPRGRQATVLVFFSPWCESYFAESRPNYAADCRRVREQTAALARSGHVRLIAVAAGLWTTREDVLAYKRDHEIAFPAALDESGEIYRRFGVNSVPTVVLLDRNGRIAHRFDANASDLETALQALKH